MALDSPSSNDSLLPQRLPMEMECLISRPGSLIFTSAYITKILVLLPICIFVLYLGLQRWRQRSTTSAAASKNSHSDIFTFHMVVFELWYCLGCTLFIYAIYSVNDKIFGVGSYICLTTWYAKNSCHALTCAERYLAVVHPAVTYLNLKGQRGVRIRKICIGCIIPVSLQKDVFFFDLSLMIFSLMVVAFCSLPVLRELIRPGPGEQGGNRKNS